MSPISSPLLLLDAQTENKAEYSEDVDALEAISCSSNSTSQDIKMTHNQTSFKEITVLPVLLVLSISSPFAAPQTHADYSTDLITPLCHVCFFFLKSIYSQKSISILCSINSKSVFMINQILIWFPNFNLYDIN